MHKLNNRYWHDMLNIDLHIILVSRMLHAEYHMIILFLVVLIDTCPMLWEHAKQKTVAHTMTGNVIPTNDVGILRLQ